MWEFSCGQWTRLAATTPSGNVDGGWAFDSRRGKVVFAAGTGLLLRATWEWDGTSWTLAYDEPLPPRDSYAVCYHAAAAEFVAVFALNQVSTWALREDRWHDLGAAAAIPNRSNGSWGNIPRHDVQYHAGSGLAVLHGGFGRTGLQTDTWVWDPQGGWREHVSATPPTPRDGTRMAYDAGRDRLVMFSGGSAADTWEWHPANGWSLAHPAASPSARVSPAIGYDPGIRRTVLFGGSDPISWNVLRDTWEWDGTTWQQVPTPAGLAARTLGHLCYAPWLGGLLLVGGATPSVPTPGVWLYRNHLWTPLVGTPPHNSGFPVVGVRYDSRRQIARAFCAPPGLPEPYHWDLSPEQLTVPAHLLGSGESLRLRYEFPQLAGGVVATFLATDTSPGIPLHPVPLVGTECLPLSADPLLFLSAQLGLVSFLDPIGVAHLTLRVPPLGGVDPVHWFAAGAAFDLTSGLPIGVSNPVPITLYP